MNSEDFNRLEQLFFKFSSEIKDDSQKFKDDIKQDFLTLKSEIKDDSQKFKDDINHGLLTFKDEIKGEFQHQLTVQREGFQEQLAFVGEGFQMLSEKAMNIFQKSDEFDAWLVGLKDHIGKAQIALRLDRAAKGNFGDCEPVGEGVCDIKHATEMASTLSKEMVIDPQRIPKNPKE